MSTLYFDLETAPRPEAVEAWLAANPFDPDSVKVGNLKDKEKIEAKVEAARTSYSESVLDRAALNPALCEILTIQAAIDDGPVMVHHYDGDERLMIETFLGLAAKHSKWINWTGNNTRSNFDLKMLYRRGWALGAEMAVTPFDADERCRDLAVEFLRFEDYPSFISLENAAREMGLEAPDSPVTGKEFWRFWRGIAPDSALTVKEQRQAAMDYAISDVELVRAIRGKILRPSCWSTRQ